MDFIRDNYSGDLVRFVVNAFSVNMSLDGLIAMSATHLMDALDSVSRYSDTIHRYVIVYTSRTTV
jgi:hypothetical protein